MSSVGQVVGGVVGAVVGYFAGGNVVLGAQIGMSIGSAVDPPDGPDGPKVEETQGSMSVGNIIALPFGLVPVSGTIIWAAPSVEHSVSSSGKGGLGQPTGNTFTYSRSYAVMFGGRPRTALLMLRRNGEIVYDKRRQQIGESDDHYQTRLVAAAGFEARNEIHNGQITELASPTIESYEGLGNVPAFRGRPYIVLIDEDVTSTGRQPAAWESVWSDQSGPNSQTTEYSNEVLYPWQLAFENPSNCLNDHRYRADTTGTWRTTVAEAFEDLVAAHPKWADAGFPLSESPIGYNSNLDLNDNISPYIPLTVDPESETLRMFYGGIPGAYLMPSNTTNTIIFTIEKRNQWLQVLDVLPLYGHGYWLAYDDPATAELTALFASLGSVNQIRASNYSLSYTPDRLANHVSFELIELERLPRAPSAPCFPRCTISPPPDMPENGAFCVIDGSPVDKSDWVLTAATFKVLSRYAVSAQIVIRYPLNPALPSTHPDYSNQAFWDAAYVDAVASGDLPSGMTYDSSGGGGTSTYPRTQSFGYTRTSVEYSDNDSDSITVAEIVDELCERSGLFPGGSFQNPDWDASNLTMLIDGFTIAQQSTGRAAIEQLGDYALFGISESDKVRYPLRGTAVVSDMTDERLGAHSDGQETPERWISTDTEDIELPKSVNLKYFERDLYAPGSQVQRKILTESDSEVQMNMAITMQPGQASALALFHLLDAYVARRGFEFAKGPRDLALEPGDVITLPDGDETQRVRIFEEQADPFAIARCRAVRDDETIIDVEGTGALQPDPASGQQFIGPTVMVPMDIPLLQSTDDNPGYYMGAYGQMDNWRGANIDRSFNNSSFARLLSDVPGASIGVAVDALPDFTGGNIFDRDSTVTIAMTNGTLSSVTEDELLDRANIAAIKSGDGWELFQFADASIQSDGSYVLSTMLRGRRGTEYLIDGHVAGDQFVLLTDALRRANLDLSRIGTEFWHRAQSIGAGGEQASEPFTNYAVGLLPLSVAHLRGSRSGSNVTFTWLRRTRYDGMWRDFAYVPLNEDTELYYYEATVNGVVVASGSNTSKSVVVVNASTIIFTVWQISGQVGRGTPSETSA